MAFRFRAGGVAALAVAAAAAACGRDPDVRDITAPASTNAGILQRYVALGNSITAGYQSGGINDSTQRASYANLLARAAGVRFAYPAIAGRGCPPPIVNFVTGARVAGDSTTCDGRTTASLTETLNNVAVPGANSFDPTGAAAVTVGTGAAAITYAGGFNALTRTLLGNLTQVQRAVDANPTFASIWIGNNDVLGPALTLAGDSTRATPLATFRNNYAAMVNQLVAGSPGLRGGVLVGVVDVTSTPLLIPIAVFNPNVAGSSAAAFQAVQGLFGVGTTRPATFQIQFDASCTSSAAAITFPALAGLASTRTGVPANAPGYVFNCGPARGTALPQTPNLVTDQERAFFVARVAAYNAYISAKADSLGWIYFNPNTALADLRARGLVPPFPNLAAPTRPFGTYISNDGVHPGTAAHQLLADSLRLRINAKYGTTIPKPDSTGL